LRYLARVSPEQVFPSPGRDVLLKRLQREAHKHDFEVVSVKLLHPRQLAPMVVVRTTEYLSFAKVANTILAEVGRGYEGFYLEAEDEFGVPFLSTHILSRPVRDPEKFPGWGLWFARSDPLKQALQAATDATAPAASTAPASVPSQSPTASTPDGS